MKYEKCKKHSGTLVQEDRIYLIDGSLILEVSSLEEYTYVMLLRGT